MRWPVLTVPGGFGLLGGPSPLGLVVGVWSLDLLCWCCVVWQGLAPLNGGFPDMLALGVLAGSPEDKVYNGLVEAFACGG